MPTNKLFIFNKPFNVLCQFTDENPPEKQRNTLAEYISVKDIYVAGRLDYDSEGLLLLTNNGKLQHLISTPKFKQAKTYWVQVEGEPTSKAIKQLSNGIEIQGKKTLPAVAKLMPTPEIWPRNPPIRKRQNIPTSWLELTLTEGRNRQVRRMTAAVGHPTLRLIRASIGDWSIANLTPGTLQEVDFPNAWLSKKYGRTN